MNRFTHTVQFGYIYGEANPRVKEETIAIATVDRKRLETSFCNGHFALKEHMHIYEYCTTVYTVH